ncbi:MAG: NAD-dependent epimerase/dehydratase family protein [Elusimicrobia bacterium]|jgi:UDP-glucose 4-epimerase|nr:NAD-dependent epimerase/dehydratase family protein [Elusimicrobiota bacterium]
MRILVTGGAGFIGSHIVDAYLGHGHQVTVVDDLSTGRRHNLNPHVRLINADIRDASLSRVFIKERFDLVNHHAAQLDVRKSVSDPVFDASVNVLGLLNLLELSRRYKVKKFIFAASGGTYYGECARPAREESPAQPLSPYGVTKLAGEHYVRAYGALHGIKFTVLRYGNVYGPRQDPHGEAGVVAIFCQRLLAGQTAFIYGNGKQQRDYVFVGDVARANIAALAKADGESVNIGMGKPTDVTRLFKILSACHGKPSTVEHKPPRTGELFRSVLDVSKAARVLKWKPMVSLEDGLAETYRHIFKSRTPFPSPSPARKRGKPLLTA